MIKKHFKKSTILSHLIVIQKSGPAELDFGRTELKAKPVPSKDLVHAFPKGGLISESFSLWLKSPKRVPNHPSEHFFI